MLGRSVASQLRRGSVWKVAGAGWRPVSTFTPSLPSPDGLSSSQPHTIMNHVDGKWVSAQDYEDIVDPLHGGVFIRAPATTVDELPAFVKSSKTCPKFGLHNPFRNVDRYLLYGEVCRAAARALADPDTETYFAKLIQRTSPKSDFQARKEVQVTRAFLDNFSGDNVRFLARGFSVPGDHVGQSSSGYRWPFGPVALITPFNFPLEIPLLQMLGALFMGNRPTVKVDSKVSVVMEQALRLLFHCGLPPSDVDFINSTGPVMNRFLRASKPRNTLFTGSSAVADKLAKDLSGRIRLEDGAFDWKILGPDVGDVDMVAYVADQDAYACSGQKCSAQSVVFLHTRWRKSGVVEKMKELAEGRRLDNLTIGPVLTWTTEALLAHVNKLLDIPGAYLLWGGKALEDHSIPDVYGAIEPTAVFVPLSKLRTKKYFNLVTTEVFGPVQVVTSYTNRQVPTVLSCLERMSNHLTAGIVSNDVNFTNRIIGESVNGVTYVGRRARTTGAPQNHWFGPTGDPRGAGIGTKEAIKLTWSTHREIVSDVGPMPEDWTIPKTT